MNTNQSIGKDTNSKLVLLSSLAATKPKRVGNCFSNIQLQAFLKHELKDEERTIYLSHLNACSDCYHQWIKLASENKKHEKESFWANLWERFDFLLPSWPIPAVTATFAVLSLLTIFVLNDTSQDLNMRLDKTYLSLAARGTADYEQTLNGLAMPWESTTIKSFNETDYTPSSRAFAAGLAFGKKELSGKQIQIPKSLEETKQSNWVKSAWSDYYALGRWTILAWSLSKPELGDTNDWDEIRSMLDDLSRQFEKRPTEDQDAQLASNGLKQLKPIIGEIQSSGASQNFGELHRHLQINMNQLFY